MKKIGLFLLALLLIMPFSLAISPFVQQSSSGGLEINYVTDNYFKANIDHDFNCHVTNATAIQKNNTTSCILHIYTLNGHHQAKINMDWHADDQEFTYLMSGNNFTELGEHTYLIQCNNTNKQISTIIGQYEITPSGTILSSIQISVYIFFLILCLTITYFSVVLFRNNRMSEDNLKSAELYQIKKRNEFLFYMNLLKKKLWIVGVFGIYISLLLFMALLNQLVYNLGLSDLDSLLRNIVVIMSWGLIPFSIFWFAWLIIVFYKSTTEIMRHQFGGMK
jgi:hypothetical protein